MSNNKIQVRVRVTLQLTVGRSVLESSAFRNSGPGINVLSDHHRFSRHGESSMTRGGVCLLLATLSLSGGTIQKITLCCV